MTALVVPPAIVVIARRDGRPWGGGTDAARVVRVLGLVARAAEVLARLVGASPRLALAAAVVLPSRRRGRSRRGRRCRQARDRWGRGRAGARHRAGGGPARP